MKAGEQTLSRSYHTIFIPLLSNRSDNSEFYVGASQAQLDLFMLIIKDYGSFSVSFVNRQSNLCILKGSRFIETAAFFLLHSLNCWFYYCILNVGS